MNKTISINISGLFFHIDEDAYEKLNDYLTAIKNSLNTEGKEEILNDVESRIAEIFNERMDSNTGVVSLSDVEYVIQLMGQPEVYRLDDVENETSDAYSSPSFKGAKKLYRDGEKRILGGVLSGISYYLNIDVVWVRIIFILLIFAYGLSIIIYPILWLIIPKARTTSEILEMKGQAVNLDNIEKTIRENFNEMGERIKNIDTQGVRKVGASAAHWIKKIIGVLFIVVGVSGIIGAIISTFTVFHLSNSKVYGFPMEQLMNQGYTHWSISLTMFGLIAIPNFILFLIGLKILYSNIRFVGIVSIFLAILWGVCISFFAIFMIDIDTKSDAFWKEVFTDNYKTTLVKKTLALSPQDTLYVDFIRDPRFYGLNDTITDGKFYDEHEEVAFIIESTNQKEGYLEIKTQAFQGIKKSAEVSVGQIKLETLEVPSMKEYYTSIEKNHVQLSKALIYTKTSDLINNSVKITLYLPEETYIQLSKDSSIDFETDAIEEGKHTYVFKNGLLTCVTCQ